MASAISPDRFQETELPEKTISPNKIIVKAIPKPVINEGKNKETLSHNTSVDKLEIELENCKFVVF